MSERVPKWANQAAGSILQSVRAKDPFTFYHCCRVGRAARRLAKAMTLSPFEQTVLEYSGLFHDVGKVGVPENILLKPGRLTEDEVEIVKAHPIKSVDIISPLTDEPFFRFLLPGVRYHHEKFDGSGYPYGIEGSKIPLPARILAVVDTVDAMTNCRPYRKALDMDVVRKELVDFSGTQFDANIVKVYLDSLKHQKEVEQAEPDEHVVANILNAA